MYQTQHIVTLLQKVGVSPGVSDFVVTRLHSCSAVKTPTAFKFAVPPNKELWFTTTTSLNLCLIIRSTTWPIDVVVVAQGGGLLIIEERGAFNYTIVCKLVLAHKDKHLF